MRNACSVGWAASTTAAGGLSSLPGFAYRVCYCDLVHTAPPTSRPPSAIAWVAARIADLSGEASFGGGAFNGLSDFFTGSPGFSTARVRLNERDKHPSLFVPVRPA